MIKRYCDICTAEMATALVRPQLEYGPLKLQVTRAVNGQWNGGDVCIDCIRYAFNEGELVEEPPL